MDNNIDDHVKNALEKMNLLYADVMDVELHNAVSLAQQHLECTSWLHHAENGLNTWKLSVQIRESLNNFDKEFQQGHFYQAAHALLEMNSQLSSDDSEFAPGLKSRLRVLEEEVQLKVVHACSFCGRIIKVVDTEPHKLWGLTVDLGILEASLNFLSEHLVDNFYLPTLLVARGSEGDIEDTLYNSFRVLAEDLFNQDAGLIAKFGGIFWPKFVRLWISQRLEACQAECHGQNKYDMLDKVASLGTKLESQVANLGFLPESERPLAKRETDTLHLHRINTMLAFLASAKPCFAKANKGNEPTALVQPFSHDRYSVSSQMKSLIELLQFVVLEATVESRLPLSAFSMVKTMAALATANLQQKVTPALPYLAALQYNDLHCLHATICTLSLVRDLPVNDQLLFIKLGQRLRHALTACFEELLSLCTSEVLSILEEFNFGSLDARGIKQCQKASLQYLHSLRRLKSVLEGVLLKKARVELVENLLEISLRQLVESVLSLEDISADDSRHIPHVLKDINKEALLIMEGLEPDRVPSALKLKELCNVMDASLLDIQDWWLSGRLYRSGLEEREVKHMVCALFEDTEHRRMILKSIT